MLLTTELSHVAVKRSIEGNSMTMTRNSESHTVRKAKDPKWVPTDHTMACIVPRQPFLRHNSSACSHPACHLPMSIAISGCLLASTQNLQDQHDSKWSLAQSCVGTFSGTWKSIKKTRLPHPLFNLGHHNYPSYPCRFSSISAYDIRHYSA